jgi:hypothetical protein
MRRFGTFLGGFVFAAIVTLTAPVSHAKGPQHTYGFYDAKGHYHAYETRAQCERARQNASNKGAVIGGVGGAVVGSAVAGKGAKTEGAVLGGVLGVMTGRQVAKKDHRC